MEKNWEAYNYEMNFVNGTKGNEYKFTLSFGYHNGSMHFNENGEICNRDYNHNFNDKFEPVSYEDTKKEFLDYFSDVNELEYINGQWFTDDYAFSIFIDDEEKYCEEIIVNKWPKQSGKNYYLQGESYRKMVRPKNTETVGREHLLNAINEAIGMLEEKYESREKA